MEIPIQINKLNNGKVLTLSVEINNEKSNFLLDTGASTSVIDLKKLNKFTSVEPLKSFNISSINKNVNAYQIKINKIKIGESILENINIHVTDLINLNNTLSTNYLSTIDGILGNDIIFELISNINIIKKTITLK